jgi:hypothetical protein
MKISKKQREILKSYLRSLAVASITTLLALVADVKPELSIIAGALVAPALRYFDKQDKAFGINSK